MASELTELPPGAFAKTDGLPDRLFYAEPRFVTHLDERAIAAVTALYRQILPTDGVILDLMGSWVSHLPDEATYREVIGHGLNAAELAANPRLTRSFVQDLNEDARLPLAAGSVDAAMICVAIQYLQAPVELTREIGRVLRPGAPLVITFANRCFPTKAVAIWQALDDAGHGRLVELYLRRAGFDQVVARELLSPTGGDPLWAVVGRVPAP